MNKSDFQALALERLADAQALLAAGRFGAAYYLTGYVVECSLKACIAKRTNQHDFPPRDAHKLYSHDLEDLARRAGLESELKSLGVLWEIVKDWSEDSRYETQEENRAVEMLAAVGDPSGVFECIRRFW